MGFFSWECKVCGKSILAPGGPKDSLAWMTQAVGILGNGRFVAGQYDGYGSICDFQLCDYEPAMYHRKCWEAVGKPLEFHGPSNSASDQGLGSFQQLHIKKADWEKKVAAYLAKRPVKTE